MPTTSEQLDTLRLAERLRNAVLDVIVDQWSRIGGPAWTSVPDGRRSPVDPEALVRVTILLLEWEPRLADIAGAWLHRHGSLVIRTRLSTIQPLRGDGSLETGVAAVSRTLGSSRERTSSGRSVLDELLRVVAEGPPPHRVAAAVGLGPAAILLRARLLLGADTRHLLIIHLLSSDAPIRSARVREWAGFTGRSIDRAFERLLESAAVERVHGDEWKLRHRDAWRRILELDQEPILLVDWASLYASLIETITFVETAGRAGVAPDRPSVVNRLSGLEQRIERAGRGIEDAWLQHLAAALGD